MNACKWCGAEQQGEDDCGYTCASWRYRDLGIWIQSSRCQQRCLEMRTEHEKTIEFLKAREANTAEALRGYIEDLQQRIADAIDAAQQAIRLNLGLQNEDGEEIDWEHDNIVYVRESDLNRVVDILQGNSLKESENQQ